MLENMKDFPTELQQDYAKALKEQCLYDNKRKYSVGTHVGNIITIDTAAISKPEIASILTHELTHALYDDFNYKEDRNLSETFVESVAFIVADYFGLDTSRCSFNYITSWADGDIKVILELGDKIQKTLVRFFSP